jgi:chorismate mutase
MSREIEALREVVDAIDHSLLGLLNGRIRTCMRIGELKREGGLPCRDGARETRLIEALRRANPGPIRSETLARIFELLLEESRHHQQRPVTTDTGREETPCPRVR